MSETPQRETPDRRADVDSTGLVDDESRAINREIWEGGPVYAEPDERAATRDDPDVDR